MKKKNNEYVEIEMTFDELAKKYFNIKDYDVIENEIIDIASLGILINSKDVINEKEKYCLLKNFIIKPEVKKHYEIHSDLNEVLKTTGGHMTFFNDQWIETQARKVQDENISLIEETMKVVDCTVDETECYYANGQLNHNSYSIPGGKAIPFYSSIRVYLEGKTKIVVKDPTLENEFQQALAEWKALGGTKSGIEKPEKPKANKENETTIGYEVTAFTKKNKTAPPDRRANFRIIFSQGLFDEECYLDQCIKYGIVKVSGAYHEIVGVKNDCGKFYRTEWMEKLNSVKEVYKGIRESLIQKLTIPLQLDMANYAVDEQEVDLEEDATAEYNVNLKENE